jgi:hypothetical protein
MPSSLQHPEHVAVLIRPQAEGCIAASIGLARGGDGEGCQRLDAEKQESRETDGNNEMGHGVSSLHILPNPVEKAGREQPCPVNAGFIIYLSYSCYH